MQCAILKLEVGSEHGPNGPPYNNESSIEYTLQKLLIMNLCDKYFVYISSGVVMRTIPLLVLSLLLSLVEEVHCQQTYPYVSFMNQTLANHSYVNISTVGSASDNSDSVVCHSDLSTCCSGGQGPHRGSWYFPNGTTRLSVNYYVPIWLGRTAQIAVIRCTTATGPTGIYRCDIATNAVHSDYDESVGETVYVGLYPANGIKLCLSNTETIALSPNTGGDITVSGEVTFDSDQMTLTCISTGGPATTVTWTRDSITVTEGTETVLNDLVTAQYTHTLTVTTGGEYTCTVSNNKPSSDSASIILGSMSFAHPQITHCQLNGRCGFLSCTAASPPSGVTAVQDGPTSIRVSWTPSSDATGYRITYTGGGSSDSVAVGDTNSHTLMGLTNGETYTISIVGTSSSSYVLPSPPVSVGDVGLGIIYIQQFASELLFSFSSISCSPQ